MLDKRDNFDKILKNRYDNFHADTPPAWGELFSEAELNNIQQKKGFLYRKILIIPAVAALIIIGLFLGINLNNNDSAIKQITIVTNNVKTKPNNSTASKTNNTDTNATIIKVINNTKKEDTKQFIIADIPTTIAHKTQPPTAKQNNENPDETPTEEKKPDVKKQNTLSSWNNKDIPKRKRGKLSLLATSSLTTSAGSTQTAGLMTTYNSPITVSINNYRSSVNFERDEYKHKFPVNVALAVRYEIKDRVSISSGLNYSYLESSAERIEKLTYSLKQRVNYLGIPVAINYDFMRGKHFSMYGLAGAMVEFNLSSSNQLSSYSKDNHIKTQKDKIKTGSPLFSLQGGVGLKYNILNRFGIFIEPGINYVFNNPSQPISYKTNTPLQFNFKIGLILDL